MLLSQALCDHDEFEKGGAIECAHTIESDLALTGNDYEELEKLLLPRNACNRLKKAVQSSPFTSPSM